MMMVIIYNRCRSRRDAEARETADMTERYLEDFEVGQTFASGRIRVDADRIKRFAAEFDPQPFHLDERAAADSSMGRVQRKTKR
jgi:acyl dehydratase